MKQIKGKIVWMTKMQKRRNDFMLIKATQTPSTYIVEILNFFNPELQLQNTESVIKIKLIHLLAELSGFKFVTTLVFELIMKMIIKQYIIILFEFKSRNNY